MSKNEYLSIIDKVKNKALMFKENQKAEQILKKKNQKSYSMNFLTDNNKVEKTKKFINVFKEKGCEFALDDFGNGYSTFSPLIHFDLDYLKFDKILVENLFDEPKQFYICDLLIDFAKRNNLKIVAEYVKCKRHEKTLEAIGVEYYQGFLYEDNPCGNIDKFI